MSDTASAIRAAKEVQADTLAPEAYREAVEWFFKARHEYKFKNFKEARDYAAQAREFAERAEYEAIRSGATRVDASSSDPYSTLPPPPPAPEETPRFEKYDYPVPSGTPATEMERLEQSRSNPDAGANEPTPAPTEP